MRKPISFENYRQFWLWANTGEGVGYTSPFSEVRVSSPHEFERLFADATSRGFHISDASSPETAAFAVISHEGVVTYSIPMPTYLQFVAASPVVE